MVFTGGKVFVLLNDSSSDYQYLISPMVFARGSLCVCFECVSVVSISGSKETVCVRFYRRMLRRGSGMI